MIDKHVMVKHFKDKNNAYLILFKCITQKNKHLQNLFFNFLLYTICLYCFCILYKTFFEVQYTMSTSVDSKLKFKIKNNKKLTVYVSIVANIK